MSARTATVGPHREPGECTQYTGVRRATPVGDRPKERRATIPKTGGHQPHNWQAGVRFNLTIVGGTHVVAAPSCAGLAFIVSEVAQGGTWVHLQRFGAEGSP